MVKCHIIICHWASIHACAGARVHLRACALSLPGLTPVGNRLRRLIFPPPAGGDGVSRARWEAEMAPGAAHAALRNTLAGADARALTKVTRVAGHVLNGDDTLSTLRRMRQRGWLGAAAFLPRPPAGRAERGLRLFAYHFPIGMLPARAEEC